MGGDRAVPNQAAYSSAKAALHHLVRCAGAEYAPRGVRINAVAPGYVRTPRLNHRLSEDAWSAIGKVIPLGRPATPAEIAAPLLFLASDLSAHVTAEILAVDGGAGVVVELLAIMATILGLSTSFAFAAMQFTSGLTSFTGVTSSPGVWLFVIVGLGTAAAVSAFFGISRGMRMISETNSVLSVVLVVAAFVFGPTLFIISNVPQTFGSYFTNFIPMSFWTDAPSTAQPLTSCSVASLSSDRSHGSAVLRSV